MQLKEFTLKGKWGWDRIGLSWRPQWSTGIEELYYGIVRRRGWRFGPVGFYRLYLRTNWRVPSYKFEADQCRSLHLDKPEDRLWHASDNTWWRRDWDRDGQLVSADPPLGWVPGRDRSWEATVNEHHPIGRPSACGLCGEPWPCSNQKGSADA